LDIIITHENADFDAIASTVAAQKLYPEASIVLGRRVGRTVRDFLALHKDRFRTMWASELDQRLVTRVIIVDVRRADRLTEFTPLVERIQRGDLEAHIYDHHAATEVDLVGTREVVEPVGSATTLLLEKIQARGMRLDTIEATLMAIGIYTDTGSLSYASTTARDARAAAWLLEQGASLKMVNRYLRTSLSAEQRDAFSRMLGAVEVYQVGGVEVGFATVPLKRNVSGLAVVTNQVLELEGHAALFSLYPIKKRLTVIARSRVPYLDVSAILKVIGGGGHAGAAAANLKGASPEETRDKLLEALHADPPRPRAVRDVMTSPVRSVSPTDSLRQVRLWLQAWGHSGVPVVRQDKLVGVLSWRDLQRAERDDRLDLPVSSCMAGQVHTTSPDTDLDDAMALMVDKDVGRLPVLREGRLVGILSRTDLLRLLYKT
jgi:tRNA nucleotidyltransferase (CCA-adding enzyme)